MAIMSYEINIDESVFKGQTKGKKSPAYLCSPSTLSLRPYLSSSLDHRNPSPESFSAQAQLAKMATSTKSPATSLRNILQENHKDSSNAQKIFFSSLFSFSSREQNRTYAHTLDRTDRITSASLPFHSSAERGAVYCLTRNVTCSGVYVSS